MNTCLIVFSVAFLLALVGSGMALLLARLAVGAARENAAVAANLQVGLGAIAARFESLQQQNDVLRQQPADSVPDVCRTALNLNKRSQVLRMHRRGDPSDQIASILEVPRQEVDLLIKVHRIIISRI